MEIGINHQIAVIIMQDSGISSDFWDEISGGLHTIYYQVLIITAIHSLKIHFLIVFHYRVHL